MNIEKEIEKETYTLDQLRKMNALDGNKKLIFVEQIKRIFEKK